MMFRFKRFYEYAYRTAPWSLFGYAPTGAREDVLLRRQRIGPLTLVPCAGQFHNLFAEESEAR